MGKNFSRNNASGKRKASDFYETPLCLTSTFIQEYGKWEDAPTLEPACGDGAITRVLLNRGFTNVTSYDIKMGKDFLEENREFTYVMTNPPFSLAHEFILKAKEIATERFALLLPLTYLQGAKRLREIWGDKKYPLESVWVFNRYPMLGEPLREDGFINTGMQTYAWYVWEKQYKGEPTIHWLDIDSYILRKGAKV